MRFIIWMGVTSADVATMALEWKLLTDELLSLDAVLLACVAPNDVSMLNRCGGRGQFCFVESSS